MTRDELIHNRAAGALWGAALGDAAGAVREFAGRRRVESLDEYVEGGVHRRLPSPVRWTDDTQMLIAVLEGLIRARTWHGLEPAAEAVAQEFVRWAATVDHGRAPGTTCLAGCGALARGVPWQESGVLGSIGSGAAMRAAGYGIWQWRDPLRAADWAFEQSVMTHRDIRAQVSAGVVALVVARLIGEDLMELAVAAALDWAETRDPRTAAVFRRAVAKSGEHLEVAPGGGWDSVTAVFGALYYALRYRGEFVPGVLAAINGMEDADTGGCIVGALLGAEVGFQDLPGDWRQKIEDPALLNDLMSRLPLEERRRHPPRPEPRWLPGLDQRGGGKVP